MSSNSNPLRRLFWFLLLATAGAAAYAWLRDRSTTPEIADAPAWPPLDATTNAAPIDPLPSPDPTTETERPAPDWLRAEPDGSCPISHPIKANEKSGIFHVPDGRFYDRTKAERCYATAEAALSGGYRQAKS
ncbi:MAG: hypothetical protein QNM02_04215 [Acidimicrobiia bacterium]|nr:hypothetical protein [Acidimicrobiia bacterium]